jgi:hypothetical protein
MQKMNPKQTRMSLRKKKAYEERINRIREQEIERIERERLYIEKENVILERHGEEPYRNLNFSSVK